jgi:threonine dehydrogenase-like Zn-dependent dehydrogenase
MRANCWHGPNDMRVDTVPDPQILNRHDAIVRITSTAICGSDLHLYNGFNPAMEPGDILGHEFMGRGGGDRPGRRSLTIKTGQAHVQRYLRPLLERIEKGEIDPSFVITHRMSLDEAPKGYRIFNDKLDDCMKVVLKV